jgi:FixJ family two-component response regulator
MNIQQANLFIVDDDRSFGRSLKRLLNARGIAADYFESAQSFLDSVPSGRFINTICHLEINKGYRNLN